MSIYMNNAATTWPKPKETAEAVFDFMTNHGANLARGAASTRDIETLDSVYTCRRTLAEMLGGYERHNAKFVTLTSNITESLNIVLKGILRPGMKVVTSSMEHNAVVRPLRAAELSGVRLNVIQCSMRGFLDPKSVEKALDAGADLAVFSHCSNVCGALQNLEDIAEVCAKYKVPLVADCAQTAGIVPISASELGLAALCFTGHKALFGPQGTGGIIWKPEFAERCSCFIEGGTGSLSHDEHQPTQMPDKFEAGTPNLPGIAGFLASLQWIKAKGMDNIRKKEDALGKRLEEGLLSIEGLKIHGPSEDDSRLPVFAVNITGKDNAVLAMQLSDTYGIETRPGLHCSPFAHRTLGTFPEGALRLSPGFFNTEDDIDQTIDALRTLAK